MKISDILFSSLYSPRTKEAVLRAIVRYGITDPDLPVLTPTNTNDDINGSQHVEDGGTDFTYRSVTEEDVTEAETFGYYEYFADYAYETYTGHYYQGSSSKFAAFVVNPPSYAAEVYI